MTRIKRPWILVVLVAALLLAFTLPVFGATDAASLKACALDQSNGTPASLAGWLMETISSAGANC